MEKPKSDSQTNTEGWKAVNWQQAEKYVFKLQKRIYAASRCGNVKRVRKLQKTLMRSWSNRVLAVRRVTQDNQGRKTAGVDGVKSLSPAARLKLAGQQIKAWLKSGVIDQGAFSATSEGTPQGGVISPLLANIALHGLEEMVKQLAETLNLKHRSGGRMSKRDKRSSLTLVRYADDFVVLHEDKTVVQRCRELISEWLKGIGLQLKPEKTRLTHTLRHELSEDNQAGFDFLGHHIQQFPVGKYRSDKDSNREILGFHTLITPTKEANKIHQQDIRSIILKHRSSPQAALIKDLNPVIRGWASYYKASDTGTSRAFSNQDRRTYLKLRRWAKRRTKSASKGHQLYWITIENNNWVFAAKEGKNLYRLLTHIEHHSSSDDYVKVKGEKSPFDGDLVYWSSRLGTHPEMSERKAKLLKQQKGKCAWCGLHFREEDVLEVDHKNPLSLGGKDEWKNLQLLHRHCHDEKTANDGSLKSVNDKR